MRLLGTLRGAADGVLHLAGDAEPILAAADSMHDEVMRMIAHHATNLGHDLPEQNPSQRTAVPVPHRPTVSLSDAGITSVIWATGYSFDYDWLHAPCLDARGEPVQQRGVTDVEGLYFLGLHWMHTFKSGTFLGVGDDAAYVADHLATHVRGR